jgi:eukaryotic-like serine/threonine-protein kinase
MPLSAGTRLGPYEILAPLGAGGMGEVYRARDSLLKRDVAVKVLPAYCSRDPERLRRFQIEAESAASLSHPNIVSIFHVGNDDGTHYIVTELLVGATLRERLCRGRMGLREVLDFVVQIARGLAAAHAVGIVHRDLKPENLFIAKDGHIKILDFGLAKLEPAKAASADGTTVTMQQQTSPGYVLGTVGYMSPEQVKGQPADVRSDIFSFGLVLYEMLTGQRAFAEATPAETMSAILGEDPPPISQTAPACPPGLQKTVDRCLMKDPDQRIQNALDLAFVLEALSGSSSAAVPAGRQMLSGRNWKRIVPALAAIAIAAVALGWWTFPAATRFVRSTRSTDAMPLRLEVRLANAATFAVSPNGQMLAFVAAGENRRNVISIRAFNSPELRELPGTEDATGAPIFWSPDSRFVGFQARNKLKKIDVSGGKLPQEICETSAVVLGGAWNRADVIVFGTPDGVMQVPAAGGVPALVTAAKNRDEAHAFPSFLPDGRHFIYIRARQEIGIYVGSLDAKPDQQSSKRMLATTVMASYVASHDQAPGRLLFMREGSLWAQSFDAKRFELFGEAVPVARHVSRFLLSAAFSASETGILAYRSSFTNTRLSWFDRQGKELGDLHESIASTHVVDLSLSLDGTQLATTRVNPNSADLGVALWITDLSRGVSTRLSSEQLMSGSPVWSADGRHLAFSVTRPGGTAIIQKASNGGGGEQLLVGISPDEKFPNDWSGDGRALLYTRREPGKNASLWLVDMANRPNQPAAPTPFADSEFNNGQGQFSPDRRWVAYTSDESGRSEVYVQELASSQGTRVKTQVSRDGGREPHWRQDGRELFYLSADGKVMSLKLSAGPMFKASIPQPLFQVADIRGALGIAAYHWGVTPDGKRFLIARDPSSSEPISIVVNWPTELNLR